MIKKYTLVLLFLVSVFHFQDLIGQTPNFVYPQNRSYPYGFQQNTISKTAASAIADTWYNDWKSRWVESCGSGIYRVKDGGGQSFSEGIGYGMLLAVYRGDKALFDGLWLFYKNNMNTNGLMNWCRSNCGGASCGNNGATDGDLDAAMALVIASCQWTGTYTADATTLITNIKNYEFTTCSGLTVQKPGDAFGGCNCTNPSYFAPGYYRAFAQFIPSQASFWTKAATDSYTILLGSAHATTGLIPAWSDSNSGIGGSGDCNSIAASGGGSRSDYQFDAARAPWRIATDYLWFGTPEAKTWLTKITGWVNTVGISNIVAGYQRNGAANVSYKNSAFTGAFALAAMASSQADANSFFTWWTQNSVTSNPGSTKLDDNPYFQNSLRTIYALLATGNMWYPCTNVPPCRTPNLGADKNICGSSFPVTLQSNTPSGSNIRFTWKRVSPTATVLVNNSSNSADINYTVTAANGVGTYVVVRDSLDGSNAIVCSNTDTIIISGTMPNPSLGSDKVVCSPSSYNLTPSNLSGFPAGTTWQWSKGGTAISGETSSTLSNVRVAGTYRLTASISGCSSTYDDVVVTSQLATPVDNCKSSAGSVTLGVTGGTGPFTWYGGTSGGPSLGTGTSFATPSISTTTTYYVEEGTGGVTGTVGASSNSIGGGWGSNDFSYKMKFDALAGLTLNSVTVYPQATANVTIRVLQSDKSTVVATKTFTNVGTGAQVLNLGFNIPQGTDYYLDATGTTQQLYMNSAGAAFPYTLSGAVSIKGSDPDWVATNGWYTYFYNWNVTVGSGCQRLPVIATIGAGCTSTCTVPSAAGAVSGPASVCSGAIGQVFSVADVTGATSYNWTVPTGATITAGTGTKSITVTFGSIAGNVSVTPVNTCGNGTSSSQTVSINALLSAAGTVSGPASVCSGATAQVYSVADVTGATSYNWTVPTGATITAGTGTKSITVTFGSTAGNVSVTPVNTCGNGTLSSIAVAINTKPSAAGTVSGPASVCSGATAQVYSVADVTGATSYNWTVPTGATITAGTGTKSIAVTFGSTAGNVSVTPVNTCGNGTSSSIAVAINTKPSAAGTVSGPASVCSGATAQVYSVADVTGATSYNWTVPTDAVITAGTGTKSITVTFGSTAGNITVTPVNTCGNGTASSQAVTINTVPSAAGTISGPASVCSGATAQVYSVADVTGATSYNWTLPTGATITSGVGTKAITVTFGTTGGNVRVVPVNSCGNGTAKTLAVAINTLPAAAGSITGSASVCSGATSQVYSVADVTGATSYDWTVPTGATITAGTGTKSITVTFGTLGGNISVTPVNTCGNGTASIQVVSINTVPATAGLITGPATVCSGATGQVFSVADVAGATSYNWSVPTGASITAGTGTKSITVTFGTAAGNVSVTPVNSCGNGTTSNASITINAKPSAAGTITGAISVCPNATGQVYSVADVAGATSYTWTVPTGATITSGAGTNSITVTFGAAAGNVRVVPVNSCGNGTAKTLAVAINTLPSAAGSITGATSVCSGASGQVYSIAAVTGATSYDWTIPVGATITTGTGTTSVSVTFGATAGNISVTPVNSCGNGTSSSQAVSINALPSAAGAISGSASVCSGATGQVYSIADVTGATSYNWTVPTGATVTAGAGTKSITVTFGTVAGTISVTPVNTCGSGAASSQAIVINAKPAAAGVISGAAAVCSGATGQVYSVADVAGATSYTWTVPSGSTITSGAGTKTITVKFGSTFGNVRIVPVNSCGNGTAKTLAVTINTLPSAAGTISGPATVCSGTAGQVYSIATVTGASSYDWTVPVDAVITAGIGTSSITVTFGTTSGNISVTPVNSCGNGTASSQAVTINALPSAAGVISGNTSVCSGVTGQVYSIVDVAGATSYNWTVPTGATIASGSGSKSITVTLGTTSGDISVTPVNTCGNGAVSTQAIIINTKPSAAGAITGTASVCPGVSGQVYSIVDVNGATTYKWTVPTGASVTSGAGTKSVTVTFGTTGGNVRVVPANSCGNGTAAQKAISILTNCNEPVITEILGPNTLEPGESASYQVTAEAGTTYTWSVSGDAKIVSGQGTSNVVIELGSSDATITVVASNAFGSTELSRNITATVTTSVKNSLGQLIKIYPNPFQDVFIMDLSSVSSNVIVKVYDIKLNLVIEQKEVGAKEEISLGNEYPSGLYIVEVISGKDNFRYKLIKQ